MKRFTLWLGCLCLGSGFLVAQPAEPAGNSNAPVWSATAAARYLDARQTWWQGWDRAKKDHDTTCISCHTVLPYALGRPALRHALGETGKSPAEQTMLASVEKRVRLWDEVETFYKDAISGAGKTAEARATEAIFNALILARYDSAAGGGMSETTRKAFGAAWALQNQTGDKAGSWTWINFHNGPWESDESQYWGATLAAYAVGLTPEDYRKQAEVQTGMEKLRNYLKREYAAQPLINKVAALWATARVGGVLTEKDKADLVNAVAAKQQKDGGLSLTDLGSWKRQDGTALETRADGYATGLTALAFRESGAAGSSFPLARALGWLAANQVATDQGTEGGLWPGWSINKQRDPKSDIGKFMNDAATAYAVLALEKQK